MAWWGVCSALFEGSVIFVAASIVIGGLSHGTAAILVAAYSVLLVFGSVQHFLDKLNRASSSLPGSGSR